MTQGLLLFLPVLAMAAALLARRYPGERVVMKLRERAAVPSPHRRGRSLRPALPALRRTRAGARGGELLGRSLAVRPPPLAPIAAG